MQNGIKFYQFSNFCFTLAKPIEDLAIVYGAKPQVEANGQRHPGSHVNRVLRGVIFDHALRRAYTFGSHDICQLNVSDPSNYAVISQLIEDGVMNLSSIKGGKVYVYSINAAEIAVKAMLGKPDFYLDRNKIVFDESFTKIAVTPVQANWKRVKNKNVPSLLDRKVIDTANTSVETEEDEGAVMTKNAMKSVLSSMTPHEQKIVRKYNQMVKATRENGRPYIKRGN